MCGITVFCVKLKENQFMQFFWSKFSFSEIPNKTDFFLQSLIKIDWGKFLGVSANWLHTHAWDYMHMSSQRVSELHNWFLPKIMISHIY